MSHTSLRLITLQDVYALATLESQVQSSPWSAEQLRESLQAGSLGWCLDNGTLMWGYCLVKPAFETVDILTIGIHPEYQGQGGARQLLDGLKAWAIEQHVESVFLEVRVSNQRAVHVYEQAGFKTIHRRANYYHIPHTSCWEDAWIMLWTH
jgi:ribosomal-protein-alanine N-acetyltransferase